MSDPAVRRADAENNTDQSVTTPATRARTPWYARPARLVLISGIILSAVVVAATYSLLSTLRERDLADKKRGLESLTLTLAEQIDRGFESIALIQASEIERMHSLGIISDEDLKRQMSDQDTYRRLQHRIAALPHVDAMVLTDADGRLVNFSRRWPAPDVKVPDRDPSYAFKADPTLQTLVGEPFHSPTTGRWIVPVSRKFTGTNGAYLGVLSGIMELDYFETLFKAVANTPSASIALFRRDGTLLVRYPRREETIGKLFRQSASLALVQDSDHGTTRRISLLDGQDRLISARKLAHHPVILAVTTTTADALANWNHTATTMAAGATIIGIVVVGAILLVIAIVGRTIREKNLQRDTALNNMSQALVMFDASARLLICNERYRTMYDLPADLVRPGTRLVELLTYRAGKGTFDGDAEAYVKEVQARIAQGVATKNTIALGDGRVTTVTEEPMENGGWVATHEDITAAKHQEEALVQTHQELLEKQYAIDQAVIVAITDTKGVITYANDRFCQISGYSRQELIGNTHRLLNSGTHPRSFFHEMYRRITTGEVWRGEVCNKAKDGSLYWVDTTITPELGHDGKPMAYMAIRVDITARKLAESKISYLASHDALTGIGNRALLIDRLEEALARCRRNQDTFAVLLIDLDGFKYVNDTLGHAAGDELLKQLSQRLQSSLRETDVVARLGGDEFAIIQDRSDDQREAAIGLAVRILDMVAEPFQLDGHDVTVGTSIGIACAPDDGASAGELLQRADLALYRVKAEGRNNFRFFDEEMGKGVTEKLQLLSDLRTALTRNEFEMHYQTVFDAKTQAPCGAEALIRWRHPTHGLIPPDRFIPLAEESGLMEPLGEWILERVCTDAAAWPDEIRVAVNLSAAQFRSGRLFDVILCALVESGLPAERLELEITETVLMQNSEHYRVVLQQLKNTGVSIALDDFGVGYSSLSYLTTFPFDKIKIDRSFTCGISNRSDCAAIIASTLTLARGLDITVTAEGVETQQQFELLRVAGVHQVQGFLFAKPSPAAELDFGAVAPAPRVAAAS